MFEVTGFEFSSYPVVFQETSVYNMSIFVTTEAFILYKDSTIIILIVLCLNYRAIMRVVCEFLSGLVFEYISKMFESSRWLCFVFLGYCELYFGWWFDVSGDAL